MIHDFSLERLVEYVSTAVLIAGRIISSNREVRGYRVGSIRATSGWPSSVVETLVQSAAIYSLALLSLLGVYFQGSNAQYICLDLLQPLIVRLLSPLLLVVE